MGNKPIAIVDVDEILWNFSSALYDAVKAHGLNFPPPKRWTHWNIFYDYATKDELFPIFDEVHSKQATFKPYDDAADFLNYMREHYYVVIASHRSPQFQPELEEWLKINNLQYDEIDLSFDKTKLFSDPHVKVVIDDRDETLNIAVSKGKRAIGLKKPWNINSNMTHHEKFRLFDTLTDIVKYLENI